VTDEAGLPQQSHIATIRQTPLLLKGQITVVFHLRERWQRCRYLYINNNYYNSNKWRTFNRSCEIVASDIAKVEPNIESVEQEIATVKCQSRN
jgi:hypothetical protein